MNPKNTDYEYKVGGSLDTHAPSYVTRQADEELYQALKASKFCYVLNSRQMGKSSLRVKTMQRLQADEIACSVVDISFIGSHNITPDEWYRGFVRRLTKSLTPRTKARKFFEEYKGLSSLQCLSEYIEEVLLKEIEQPTVIFIDEIDSILKLDFKDDFFAFIRACYENRQTNPKYKRLTFVLLGVATPSDLMTDKTRTPFNIGQAITLSGFKLEETKPLEQGLIGKAENPEAVLEEVLTWTGGQPFLTQKLCQLIINTKDFVTAGDEPELIKQLVLKQIVENWESQDYPDHLKVIRDRVLRDEGRMGRLLGLYQKILHDGQLITDDSPEQMELRLTGIVVKRNKYLIVYNPIYKEVFNSSWVEKQLEKLRPYSEAIKNWVASGFQDESQLLRKQTLGDARKWAKGKSLSDLDYRFLAESQALEKEEVEKALEAEKEAKNILFQAQKKAKKMILTGAIILAFFSVLSVIGGVISFFLERELRYQKSELEVAENNALVSQIEALNLTSQSNWKTNNQLDALLAIIKAMQEIKNSTVDIENEVYSGTLNQAEMVLSNLREINRFNGHTSFVLDVAFSPDGKMIASASRDNTVKLWSISGELLHTFTDHNSRVKSVAFSPNGEMIASGSRDNTVKLWSISGKLLHTFEGHKDWLEKVTFSPNGKMIASASRDNTVKLWSVDDKKILNTLTGHNYFVLDIAFSPNGELLASASSDHTIKFWDIETGKNLRTIIAAENASVTTIDFSPDGSQLVSGSGDNFIKIWNVKSGNEIERVERTRRAEGGIIWDVSFSLDGRFILTTSNDNIIRVWDSNDLSFVSKTIKFNNNINTLNFSPDGKTIALASNDATIRIWNWDIETEHNKIKSAWRIGDFITTLSQVADLSKGITFGYSNQFIITGSNDKEIKVWDLEGNLLQAIPASYLAITNAILSPDRKTIASTGVDKKITLWNRSGAKIRTLEGHTETINQISFSPNSQLIASASWDDTVRIWSIDGDLLTTINAHGNDNSLGVSFSPDSQSIVTGGADSLVKTWNIEGELVREFRGHTNVINSVNFNHNGSMIASAGYDNTINLWSTDGNLLNTFKGHNDVVEKIIFSPNGKLLASASWDQTVKIWHIDGDLIKTFSGDSYFLNLEFSKNGKMLAAIDSNNVVRVWDIENSDSRSNDIDLLLKQGCEWIEDYLANNPMVNDSDKNICSN